MRNLEKLLRPGNIVKHFKRETVPIERYEKNAYLYKIICVAIDANDNNNRYVIYQALYDNFEIYSRPYEEFISKVDIYKYPHICQEYRFETVDI